MKVGEICNRNVIAATSDTTGYELSLLMLKHHVGSVVILESNEQPKVIGIVTDRDLVLQMLAKQLDPNITKAAEIMTSDVITESVSQGVLETMRQMRSHGIRRLPIIDHNQRLVGILSLDDLLDVIVSELGELSNTITSGRNKERLQRRAS